MKQERTLDARHCGEGKTRKSNQGIHNLEERWQITSVHSFDSMNEKLDSEDRKTGRALRTMKTLSGRWKTIEKANPQK
jgi:hypothetical protein